VKGDAVTDDEQRREGDDLAAGPSPPTGEIRMIAPLADDDAEGATPSAGRTWSATSAEL
jgi:hypothetical protein